MSSLCLRPRHQHSALWWHWRKRRAEKKRNRGRLLSSCHQICSNCTSECRRGREGVGLWGRGLLAQWQGAQWWHSSLSCGHTDNTAHAHTAAPGGFPSGVPKWSNTTHHCLITPVTKDRREECFHEPWHRRCTVYHSGIVGHYMMLSWCVFHFFKPVCVCMWRERESERAVMHSSLCVMFCIFPRLFDGRFIMSVVYGPAMKIGLRDSTLYVYILEGGCESIPAPCLFLPVCAFICVCSSVCVCVCVQRWQFYTTSSAMEPCTFSSPLFSPCKWMLCDAGAG